MWAIVADSVAGVIAESPTAAKPSAAVAEVDADADVADAGVTAPLVLEWLEPDPPVLAGVESVCVVSSTGTSGGVLPSAGSAVPPADGCVCGSSVASACSALVDDGAGSGCAASESVSEPLSAVSLESAALDDAVPDVFVSSVGAEALLVEPVLVADESVSADAEDVEPDPLPAELVVDPLVLLDAEPPELEALAELDDDPESDDEPVVSAAATP
jgi:hypothetical protein